ncbi:uncharacterized protein LOC143430841 [Xylocopa sonorina]|uniref:uncharacterized protein LOC143430841 n=1 Tax=Xylocopa sonorina TaxID=1818115 RepID=UPI00403B0FF2
MNDRSQSCFDSRTETDFYETGVFRAYRSYLTCCGLWPYESFALKQARRIVCSMSIVLVILVQIFVLFTRQITVDLLFDISPIAMISVIVLVKYVTFWIKYEGYKEILEHMRNDWNRLTEVEQIPLKRAYEVSSRYCTLNFVLTCSCCTLTVVTYFLPKIVITITGSNVSQSIKSLVMTEYFVDDEKYFVPISIHLTLTCMLSAFILVSTDCVNTVIPMHISGIFQVIGLLLVHMFDKSEITNQKMDEALVHYERLLRFIDWHKRNLKSLKNLTSPVQDVPVVITYTFLLCLCCFFTFLFLVPAETLYEDSGDMFFKAYCGYWYTAPMKSQKLLLFLMQRLLTPYKLEVKNIVSASIETSTTVNKLLLQVGKVVTIEIFDTYVGIICL